MIEIPTHIPSMPGQYTELERHLYEGYVEILQEAGDNHETIIIDSEMADVISDYITWKASQKAKS